MVLPKLSFAGTCENEWLKEINHPGLPPGLLILCKEHCKRLDSFKHREHLMEML